MHQTKALFLGAALLLAAGPAFAEGDDAAAPPPAGGGAAGDATGAGAGSGSAAAPTDTGGAAAGGGTAMIDRHYVADKGKVAAYVDVDVAHVSITVGTVTASATGELLHLGGAYGITDKISAGLDYAFPFAGDTGDKGKGPLALFGMFELAHSAKMSITATADFTADLGGSDGMGGSKTIKTIHAGLGAKYLVAPKIAIFTGAPVGPGPVGQHLSVSLESSGPIDFSLPIGAGMQVTPEIFAYVETNLATFHLANKAMGQDSVAFIGSDAGGIPMTLGGFYAVNKQIDAGLNLTFPDLKHAGDFYEIGVAARWRQ